MNEQTDAGAILARLAVRSGLSLGGLASGRADAFRLLLACAASTIPPGVDHSERAINDLLSAWLAGAGSMLATDHVSLRRWLVDTALLERDGYGRCYRRGETPAPAFADALSAIAHLDVASLVAEARRADAQKRDARRAAHAARTGGSR